MRKCVILVVSLAIVVWSGLAGPAPVSEPAGDNVSWVHWLGKRQIAADPQATNVLGIWNLRETTRIQNQTLDKLAFAPWRMIRGQSTNSASTRLRPLLEDLIQQEWYAEVQPATNGPGGMALVVHLDSSRQALWDTNLAVVVESWTGIKPEKTDAGWSLTKHHFPDHIELEHSSDWLVLTAGGEDNRWEADLIKRVQSGQTPTKFSGGNWLECDVDPRQLAEFFAPTSRPPSDLPRITLAVADVGTNVMATGSFLFPEPLQIQLEPWNIPTNLMDGQVTSITAARGTSALLKRLENWAGLKSGPTPNEVFLWSCFGLPAQEFLAAPLTDATNKTRALIGHLTTTVNPLAARTDNGSIVPSPDFASANWEKLPFLTPTIQIAPVGPDDFLWAGSMPLSEPFSHPSPSVLKFTGMGTNLVYYNSEITGPRVDTWLYIFQLMRMALDKAQLPPDSASTAWMKKVAPKLGDCTTTITLVDPRTLAFSRESTLGLSALEIQVLADWLESPRFPCGLNTFTGGSN